MSAFILKIVACCSMFIDHIGYVIMGGPSFFNYIGRFAFPIFAFQISEGFVHTKNLRKYMLRLFIFALISQIPFMLFSSLISNDLSLNVIFTLILGLLAIFFFNSNKIWGSILAILLGFIAQFLHCDYGFYGVAITLFFYIFRNNKIKMACSFCLLTIAYYGIETLTFMSYGIDVLKAAFAYYLPYTIFTLFSIIFILFYNKKKGVNTKYLLYLFYPFHLLFIYILKLIFF